MKKKILAGLNVVIIIFEVIALFMSFDEFGYKMFTYYTQYSNILALISSCLFMSYIFKNKIPKWLCFFRYMVTNLLTMTFLIVTFVLVPMLVYTIGVKGFMLFTYGSMLYHHLLCPILYFLSFVFFEKRCRVTKRDSLYVIVPTIAYGIVMVALNIFKVVDGPYPFLRVLHQPIYATIIWIILILLLSYLVSATMFKIKKKYIK